jgi:hypothetical protein
VVQRHEADLGGEVARCGYQPLVSGHQLDVEDLAKRFGDALAGSSYVRTDDVRGGDHLVLEAGVELHVTRLVDLLGGQERRFLLRPGRGDQPRELGRHALFGDHQRRQREQQQLALLARRPWPLHPIGVEVDRERRPLRVLPAPVQRLWLVELKLVTHAAHSLAQIASLPGGGTRLRLSALLATWTRGR